MANQPPLFDDITPDQAPANRSLTLRARPDQPLTKTQKAFNRLLTRIKHLRTRLDADKQLFEEVRKEVVRALVPFLDDRRLKKGDGTSPARHPREPVG